jgi:hypothetical protein
MTGYYGGEMTYHHAVGVTGAVASGAGSMADVRPLIPAKPFVALLGFLSVVGLGAWLALGRQIAPAYFPRWWQAVRQELVNANARLWTLRRGAATRPAESQRATRAYGARA